MQAIHKTLLEVNEEFLVSEAPAEPLLRALQAKEVLTDLDFEQLRSLNVQGSRAVKRFVLHVLPLRGPLAFPAFLESLQEAKAQHLVDLLLEEEAALRDAVKPIELPERRPDSEPKEDPNEYARKLRVNLHLIEDAVDPKQLISPLLQANVLSSLEIRLMDEVAGQPALMWSVLWAVLMQRGMKAYNAFMGALLQHDYSALFHTIQETKVSGVEALQSTLTRNMEFLMAKPRQTPVTPAPSPNQRGLTRQSQASILQGGAQSVIGGSQSTAVGGPQVPAGGVPPDAESPLFSPRPPPGHRPGGPSHARLSRTSRHASGGDISIQTGTASRDQASARSALPLNNKPFSANSSSTLKARQTSSLSNRSPVPSTADPYPAGRQQRRVTSGSSRSVAIQHRTAGRVRHLRPIHYSLGPREFRSTSRDDVQTVEGLRSSSSLSRVTRSEEDALYSPTWTDRYDHLRRTDSDTPRLSIGLFTPLSRRNSNPETGAPLQREGSGDTNILTDKEKESSNRVKSDDDNNKDKENSGDDRRNNKGKELYENQNNNEKKENNDIADMQNFNDAFKSADMERLLASLNEYEEGAIMTKDNDKNKNKDMKQKDTIEKEDKDDKENGGNKGPRRKSYAGLLPEEAFGIGSIQELDNETESPRKTSTPKARKHAEDEPEQREKVKQAVQHGLLSAAEQGHTPK